METDTNNKFLKVSKTLALILVIALAFEFATSYELYKLSNKFRDLQANYISLALKKNRESGLLPAQHRPGQNIDYTPVSPTLKEKRTLAQINKNPLNIKRLGGDQKWQGQLGVDKFGHVKFASWEHGVRAASFTLRAYARTHKIDTVEDLVSRFCTAQGRNYWSYVNYICRRIHVKSNQKIDLVEYMPKLLRIMARYESGIDLPEELFVPYDVIAFL